MQELRYMDITAEKLTKTVSRQKFTTTETPGCESAEKRYCGRESHRKVCRGRKYVVGNNTRQRVTGKML
jgi:hypothetical protein